MRLAYVLLSSLYVYLVSLNTYEHMQHYIQSIRTTVGLITSSPHDMNAIMYYLSKWKVILNTPHLMLFMLRTLATKLTIIRK